MISGLDHGYKLLLVHAHPDDETLTTGGTIARYVQAGAEVTVVTCTLGEEGEIIPAELDELGSGAADQLGGYRAGELRAACAQLGVSRHRYLGGIGRWRDSGMSGTAAVHHPRALASGALGDQTEQLATIVDEVRPQVVVSYDSFGGYGHPDHIRAHEITMAAGVDSASVRRVFHTITPAEPARRGVEALHALDAQYELPFAIPALDDLPTVADERAHTAVDISGNLDRKFAALRAHRTQISVWQPHGHQARSGAFALSNGTALPNLDTEYFELVHGDAEGIADDLFGGMR